MQAKASMNGIACVRSGTSVMPLPCARWFLLGLAACILAGGCSFKKLAVNKLGSALASGGTTFTDEEDPELVKAAAIWTKTDGESARRKPKAPGFVICHCQRFHALC